ncbi:intradiol ring-cleavage dioxygenase [Microvirga sp. GCM10011540]|uniref:dioxygenase family protein n=1 Tax=Microvirga sp. GCM10011540 TaxID=3317338 RepID=UPI00361B1420
MSPTRRTILTAFLAAPALSVLGDVPSLAQGEQLSLPRTPACDDEHELTTAQTEGPYFKPDAPLRHDLVSHSPVAESIIIAGFVLDTACRPIPGALVQVWHADSTGAYDNAGYRFRGFHYADERGRWWFSTIVPAAYPGRTRHYHFKVQRPGDRILTTQLYFPDEALNRRDRLFDERLLLRLQKAADGRFGRYDFIV